MRHDWSQTQGFGAEDWSSMCLGRSIWCSAWTCFFFCLAVVVIPSHTWLKNNSNSMTPIAYLGVYIFRRFATWRILNPWILWRDTGISTIWYGLVQKCYEYPTFYDKFFFFWGTWGSKSFHVGWSKPQGQDAFWLVHASWPPMKEPLDVNAGLRFVSLVCGHSNGSMHQVVRLYPLVTKDSYGRWPIYRWSIYLFAMAIFHSDVRVLEGKY